MPDRRPYDTRNESGRESRGFKDRVRDLAREEIDWFLATKGAIGERLLAGSVPWDAVEPIPVFPSSAMPKERFNGQTIDVLFPADNLYRRCTWRQEARGGVGAWLVTGAPPFLVAQSSQSDHNTGDVTTYTPMVRTPELTVPAGVWDVGASGGIQILGLPTVPAEGRVALRLNGVVGAMVGWSSPTNSDGLGSFTTRGPSRLTFAVATTITLAVATSGETLRFGGPGNGGLWILKVTPIELHP